MATFLFYAQAKYLLSLRLQLSNCLSELSRCALIMAVSMRLEPIDVPILIKSRLKRQGFRPNFSISSDIRARGGQPALFILEQQPLRKVLNRALIQ